MVAKALRCATRFVLAAAPALAETAKDRMFSGKSGCYSRSYSAEHLAAHPDQQVTRINVAPMPGAGGEGLVLRARQTLRCDHGGEY
jgi:hypothetical protein